MIRPPAAALRGRIIDDVGSLGKGRDERHLQAAGRVPRVRAAPAARRAAAASSAAFTSGRRRVSPSTLTRPERMSSRASLREYSPLWVSSLSSLVICHLPCNIPGRSQIYFSGRDVRDG